MHRGGVLCNRKKCVNILRLISFIIGLSPAKTQKKGCEVAMYIRSCTKYKILDYFSCTVNNIIEGAST